MDIDGILQLINKDKSCLTLWDGHNIDLSGLEKHFESCFLSVPKIF